jgi:hypothetical protein
MMRRVVLALVLALLIPRLAAGQAKPDFSGAWALDAAKSDMGMGRPGDRPEIAAIISTDPKASTSCRMAAR